MCGATRSSRAAGSRAATTSITGWYACWSGAKIGSGSSRPSSPDISSAKAWVAGASTAVASSAPIASRNGATASSISRCSWAGSSAARPSSTSPTGGSSVAISWRGRWRRAGWPPRRARRGRVERRAGVDGVEHVGDRTGDGARDVDVGQRVGGVADEAHRVRRQHRHVDRGDDVAGAVEAVDDRGGRLGEVEGVDDRAPR